MIDYDDAMQRLLDGVRAGGSELVPASSALGRILAMPVLSNEALPLFDNSAMDGFALRFDGTVAPEGSEFSAGGEVAAGDGMSVVEGAFQAVEIMTGAPLPSGCSAVVPIEQVTVLAADASGRATRIRVQADVAAGQHVRREGHDVAASAGIAAAGTQVDAALHMLLAAVGVSQVDVRVRPRVALLNTGRELVDDPSQPLAAGQIRNSNGPFLQARLACAGAEVVARETVGDDADAFIAALARAEAAGATIVISTGAVSMGRYDFIPAALAQVGARVLFHKVRIRPGKPILAAQLPSGAMFFGLPGNPASTAVGLRFFVEPVIRALLGMPVESALHLPLLRDFTSRVPLRLHLKARLRCDALGRVGVEVLDGQESFRIQPLAHADAWAVIPSDRDNLAQGELVQVVGLGHLEHLVLQA